MWTCPKDCGRQIDESNADMIIDHVEVCDHTPAAAVPASAQERADKTREEVFKLVSLNRGFIEHFYQDPDTDAIEHIARDIEAQGRYVHALVAALAEGETLPERV